MIGIIVLFVMLGLTIFLTTKRNNKSDNNTDNKKDDTNKKSPLTKKDNKDYYPQTNFITPANFSVGLLGQQKYKAMNNCTPDVLYPINGLGPDYGWKMPNDCRCTEFVRSP
jgi:hypothetical protein